MRELSVEELDEVNGGLFPVVYGLATAAVGHAAARSLGTYALSRVGTITAVYSAAQYFGGSGGSGGSGGDAG